MNELQLWNLAFSRVGDLTVNVDASQSITAASAANPVVITSAAHGLSSGRYVLIDGMATMTQISRRIFKIARLDANSYQLVGEDGISYTADITGGVAYPLEDTEAVRKAALVWPAIRDEVLRLHPWNACTKYGRLSRLQTAKTITNITRASEAVVSVAAHGYSSNDYVLLESVVGMTEVNDRYHSVTVLTSGTFKLNGEDSTNYTAYSSGGTAKKAITPLKPDFGYAYRYPLPSDCVRAIELSGLRDLWEVVGRYLLTDAGITVPLRYVYFVRDPLVFDAALASVLAARLALEMVETLTQSNTKKDALRGEYEDLLARAKGADAQESSPMPFQESEWNLARQGILSDRFQYTDWDRNG